MPWCDDCARFWNPSSMGEAGQCPTCGRVITKVAPPPAEAETGETAEAPRAPWHFKLMVVALVIYLGYRAVQGVMWLAAHL